LKGFPADGSVAGSELIQKIGIGKPFFVTFRYNYVGTKSEIQELMRLRSMDFSERRRNATRAQVERGQVEKEAQVRSASGWQSDPLAS
jgi:hypothetical protein